MNFKKKTLCLLLLVSLFIGGWIAPKRADIERPRDVWVMRTVLDKKPRMLSIALNNKLWVAYNTQTGGLYKAWGGVVNFEGSVFNGDHNFQPSTQGISFINESDEIPWRIIVGGKTITPEVVYKGHSLVNDQVVLKYDLKFDGETIGIEEKPEYLSASSGSGITGFERVFTILPSKSKAEVALLTHIGSITSEKDYRTDGKLAVLKSSSKEVNGKKYVEQEALLYLNKKGKTNWSVHFRYEDRPVAVKQGKQPKEGNIVEAIMAKSDCALCHHTDKATVGPSYISIANRYSNTPSNVNSLALKVINGGAGNWGNAVMTPHPDMSLEDASILTAYILDLKKKAPEAKPTAAKANPAPANVAKAQVAALVKVTKIPGDGHPLQSVHPSFDLTQARPDSFKPRVGGMDFLADGRMVVSTWDSIGAIYILEGVQGKNPQAIKVKRIAAGLAEPLGLKVVDNDIYVLQKQELTRLVDLNNDDIIDEYQSFCNGWGVSDNFHEFAFGLVYKDGYFYGTLATAINNGGASTYPQVEDRGKVVKISKKDGSYSLIASGLRTPNGIGLGVDNEIFIADNQGDWLPANKLVHLQDGAFYGSRSVDFEGTKGLTETQPLVWLAQDEIGNSPSQPVKFDIGPYKNQMVHGDVTHGGLKRVFVEKINNVYQGAVFRFTQGLEGGVNRLVWGPDKSLYIGEVGLKGNWGQSGKLMYGLQKLTYNNKVTFEMLAVRVKPNGMEIEFTESLKEGQGGNLEDYLVKQWTYTPTEHYGGPKVNLEDLKVESIQVSSDRRKVMLNINGMKEKHVVYIKLNRETVNNQQGANLWTTEAWYTLNSLPR